MDTIYIPRTSLADDAGHIVIVLECACGYAIPYPGQVPDRSAIQCDRCGTTWQAVTSEPLLDRFGIKGHG